MEHADLLADLQARELVSPKQAAAIDQYERTRPFSLYYELRTLLYIGIVLLTTGLGILLYQHLDNISHGVIVLSISLILVASFTYAAQNRQPFTWGKTPPSGLLPDYILLLGCLMFLVLEGYLQFTYELFGTRYGVALFLPAVLFFWLAYRSDHHGVLSMAITALASWLGVSVAPLSAFTQNYFSSYGLTVAAIGLGSGLLLVGLGSDILNRKRHFAFTHILLGSNLALLAAIAALFNPHQSLLLSGPAAALFILLISAVLIWYARRSQSYIFLLMGMLYGYVALTYFMFRISEFMDGDAIFLLTLYIPLTALGIVFLFINGKKLLRQP